MWRWCILHFCFYYFAFHFQITLSQETACYLQVNGFDCEFVSCTTDENLTLTANCCNISVDSYFDLWRKKKYYLTTFLKNLKTWNYVEFEDECQRQSFALTTFSELIYLKFCNQSEFEQRCTSSLQYVLKRQLGKDISFSWYKAVEKLNLYTLTDVELLDPCIQALMYDENSDSNRFHEVISIVPFCDVTWCGFDQIIFETKSISSWTCMSQRCRTNFGIILIIYFIMAVMVTICNITILVVFLTNKKLQNTQAIFKISLAFSDLLVGIIVFPSMIVNTLISDVGKNELSFIPSMMSNGSGTSTKQTSIDEVRNTSIRLCRKFPSSYVDAIGFFTVLSTTVSMCTLVAAALDRFTAVITPMKYKRRAAVNIAKKIVVIIWIVMAVFASLPWFTKNFLYSMEYAPVPVPEGYGGAIVFSVMFGILLVIMWITAIATIKVYQNHQNNTRHLQSSVSSKRESASHTRNMLIILAIMVGVFTLSLLPIIIFLLLSSPDLPSHPEEKSGYFVQDLINFTSAKVIVAIFLLANSLWNFFIYSARDDAFRKACRHFYGRLFLVIRDTLHFTDTSN